MTQDTYSLTPLRRSLYRYAVDLFVFLLDKVQQHRKPYRCNDGDVRAWNKFVDYYTTKGVHIGQDFVKSFAEYGIQSWFNDDCTETQKHNCRFSWIFGLAAIRRYNKFGAKGNARIVRNVLKQTVQISYRHASAAKDMYRTVRKSEERFKSEFFNTKRGLAWCIANTTLYFHRSSLCALCNYKAECKEELKNNYPKIHKLRGYDDR